MLNDREHDEFDALIEDEDGSIYPPPGVEIGTLRLKVDRGSGSYAQDGPLEVAEDHVMLDGEDQLGSGNIAVEGPTEIGHDDFDGVDRDYRTDVGADFDGVDRNYYTDVGAAAAADREAEEIGIGQAAMDGQSEIGAAGEVEPTLTPFDLFMASPTRMGAADRGYGDEIGAADRGYGDEIGSAAMYGQTEIGDANVLDYGYEIGAAEAADRPGSEIVGAAAVVKVIKKARDNRQPAPPMRAVDVDAPFEDDDWGLTDMIFGAAAATGNPDPFPLTSKLLLRAGAGSEPRYVRVDTEDGYKRFKATQSPEMAALSTHVAELSKRLDDHLTDPEAHSGEISDDLSEDIDDLVHLGAEAQDVEAAKRIELWMPKRFDGLLTAWREGEFVCVSFALPGSDGELRICTTLEPIRKCVAEMSRHAAEAGVPAAAIIGVLPAMGCVLGAGTAMKEMAAAVPAILHRPEAAQKTSFEVRIEPRTCPTLFALAMLVMACRAGDQQACSEWKALGEISPGPVKQAMVEALQLAKAAA